MKLFSYRDNDYQTPFYKGREDGKLYIEYMKYRLTRSDMVTEARNRIRIDPSVEYMIKTPRDHRNYIKGFMEVYDQYMNAV